MSVTELQTVAKENSKLQPSERVERMPWLPDQLVTQGEPLSSGSKAGILVAVIDASGKRRQLNDLTPGIED